MRVTCLAVSLAVACATPDQRARDAPLSSGDGRAAEYEQKCAAGNAEACGALGALFQDGTGVEKDYARAAKLFQRACDLGSASGCGRLGVMYSLSDKGLDKDVTRSVTLFRRSCDLGSANGCMAAGVFLEVGNGVPQDPGAAAALYARACDGGAKDACHLLRQLEKRLQTSR
jgi:uncharacterized protein